MAFGALQTRKPWSKVGLDEQAFGRARGLFGEPWLKARWSALAPASARTRIATCELQLPIRGNQFPREMRKIDISERCHAFGGTYHVLFLALTLLTVPKTG